MSQWTLAANSSSAGLTCLGSAENFTSELLLPPANYSQPIVTRFKLSDSSFNVTCESYGGYPESKLRWNVSKGGVLYDTKYNAVQNPDGRFNISFTANVNCSQGEVSFTCTANDRQSGKVALCEYQADCSPPSHLSLSWLSQWGIPTVDKLWLSVSRKHVWGILGEFLHPISPTGLISSPSAWCNYGDSSNFCWDV